jgi:hypothetical protein
VDKVILYMDTVQELHDPTTSSILDFGFWILDVLVLLTFFMSSA